MKNTKTTFEKFFTCLNSFLLWFGLCCMLSLPGHSQQTSIVQTLGFFDGRPVSGVKISSDYGLEAQVSDENGVVEFRFRPDAPLLAPSLNFEKEGWILPDFDCLFVEWQAGDTLKVYLESEIAYFSQGVAFERAFIQRLTRMDLNPQQFFGKMSAAYTLGGTQAGKLSGTAFALYNEIASGQAGEGLNGIEKEWAAAEVKQSKEDSTFWAELKQILETEPLKLPVLQIQAEEMSFAVCKALLKEANTHKVFDLEYFNRLQKAQEYLNLFSAKAKLALREKVLNKMESLLHEGAGLNRQYYLQKKVLVAGLRAFGHNSGLRDSKSWENVEKALLEYGQSAPVSAEKLKVHYLGLMWSNMHNRNAIGEHKALKELIGIINENKMYFDSRLIVNAIQMYNDQSKMDIAYDPENLIPLTSQMNVLLKGLNPLYRSYIPNYDKMLVVSDWQLGFYAYANRNQKEANLHLQNVLQYYLDNFSEAATLRQQLPKEVSPGKVLGIIADEVYQIGGQGLAFSRWHMWMEKFFTAYLENRTVYNYEVLMDFTIDYAKYFLRYTTKERLVFENAERVLDLRKEYSFSDLRRIKDRSSVLLATLAWLEEEDQNGKNQPGSSGNLEMDILRYTKYAAELKTKQALTGDPNDREEYLMAVHKLAILHRDNFDFDTADLMLEQLEGELKKSYGMKSDFEVTGGLQTFVEMDRVWVWLLQGKEEEARKALGKLLNRPNGMRSFVLNSYQQILKNTSFRQRILSIADVFDSNP
ncbi:hypothetical protein LAG90_04545 [Marinilongibacter aquaticus]|uniref:hypothetical protein n=1 Tax=Marinilongibacter aquaticus TaxID=2975157 RepID=UPI0021BDC263|nr:hypothetical protein [Marinilongibacter aquaticus]UBM59916.1 hypothetical protein LAG90_04545 [Marinilongibacter aquaticus]